MNILYLRFVLTVTGMVCTCVGLYACLGRRRFGVGIVLCCAGFLLTGASLLIMLWHK